MSSRLLTAVEAFLKHLEHLVGLEPTASVQAHIPVPELTELRAAHAEAAAPPAAEPPTPAAADASAPSHEDHVPEAAPAPTAAPETEPPPA